MGRCYACCQENCNYQKKCSCYCHSERKEQMDLSDVALVTHQGCMDGSTCALVFLAAGGKEENVYFTLPSHDISDEIVNYLAETHNGPIIVADMSISLGLAEKLNQHNAGIFLLDHHRSAIPLDKFEWCEIEVDNQRAGGRMLWDHFREFIIRRPELNQLKDLVMAADDVDRWVKEIPVAEDLVTLHDAIEQQDFIDRFKKNPLLHFSKKEQYLIDVYKAKRDRYVERKKRDVVFFNRKIQGHRVRIGVVQAGTHQSILGNAICTDPDLNVDVAIMSNGISVSMRSSSSCPVDLAAIAKLNGGGGHFNAAGVSAGKVIGEDFAEFIYGKIKFEVHT